VRIYICFANNNTPLALPFFSSSYYLLHTTYLDVPWQWNGLSFIELAQRLKENNKDAYKNFIMKIEISDEAQLEDLMSKEEYEAYIETIEHE